MFVYVQLVCPGMLHISQGKKTKKADKVETTFNQYWEMSLFFLNLIWDTFLRYYSFSNVIY